MLTSTPLPYFLVIAALVVAVCQSADSADCPRSQGRGSRAQLVLDSERQSYMFPMPMYRYLARDYGPVMKHGSAPGDCDKYGARDVWVWKHKDTYYMHYDGAGPEGWLVCLATSKDLTHWRRKGAVIDLGERGRLDSATASYGVTYFDGSGWHMFYLGSPKVSPPPDRVPMGPYYTLKAEADSPEGPWRKRYDIPSMEPNPNTGANVGPGHVIKNGDEYMMFFSGLAVARTRDLDKPWKNDGKHLFDPDQRCENSSLYFEEANDTWFMFSNHVGDGYTDAIWVYWTKDINHWDPENAAVVLDGAHSKWSRTVIGLPSVVRVGNQLAIFYDGNSDPSDTWHMKRDIGLAWLDLPLIPPTP